MEWTSFRCNELNVRDRGFNDPFRQQTQIKSSQFNACAWYSIYLFNTEFPHASTILFSVIIVSQGSQLQSRRQVYIQWQWIEMQDCSAALSVFYSSGWIVSVFQTRILTPFIAPLSCDKLGSTDTNRKRHISPRCFFQSWSKLLSGQRRRNVVEMLQCCTSWCLCLARRLLTVGFCFRSKWSCFIIDFMSDSGGSGLVWMRCSHHVGSACQCISYSKGALHYFSQMQISTVRAGLEIFLMMSSKSPVQTHFERHGCLQDRYCEMMKATSFNFKDSLHCKFQLLMNFLVQPLIVTGSDVYKIA